MESRNSATFVDGRNGSQFIESRTPLHSDNGREFVNEIAESVVKEWPGEVTIGPKFQDGTTYPPWLQCNF